MHLLTVIQNMVIINRSIIIEKILILSFFFFTVSGYAQTRIGDSTTTSFMHISTESMIFNRIKFKSLELQLNFIEENHMPIKSPNLNTLSTKTIKKYQENFYIKSINPNSKFVNIKDWDNPYGVNTFNELFITGALNAILEKIQQ